jgi:hypothetical protein
MGPSRFTSHPRGSCAADFYPLKNPSPWPGFEPVTFGPSGQHTNHYTTEATHTNTVNVFKIRFGINLPSTLFDINTNIYLKYLTALSVNTSH